MIRRLTAGAAGVASLLLLACLPSIVFGAKAATVRASARPAAPVDTAPALFDSVAAHYAQLSRFYFSGQTHVEISGAAMPKKNVLDIPFVFAAIRPSRLRTEMQNPAMPSTLVSDGDTLWVLAQSLRQYTAQAAPSIVPGSASSDPMTRSLDPLQSYALMREGVLSVTTLGPDTVMTAAGPVSCRMIVATYTPDSSAGAPQIQPRVLWVDESRMLVLRDSLSMNLTHPQMGALTSFQDTRFVVLDDRTGGPDSLYRFVPPADSRKVARIGAPEMTGPDHTGEPAFGFTLPALDGKPVTLSKLKGKVVVLDFWATWCGPCRRWMPIVEKVARENATKGVVLYAINLRETPAQVRAYLTKAGVKVPVLLDKEGAIGTAYGASSIPLTVVIGRDGKIVKTMVGLHGEEDMRAALREAGIQ